MILYFISGLFIGSFVSGIWCYMHHKYVLEKELINTNKFKALFELSLSWICAEHSGYDLPRYLSERGYKKVAIYGMGKVGKALADELQQSGIDVAYGIDINNRNIVTSFPIVSPTDKFDFVDLIIVTAISPTGEIEEMLKEKTSIPVLALGEIIAFLGM